MKWIDASKSLPKDDCRYTKYLVTVLWLDTFLDKGEYKSYTDVAKFNSFRKLWVDYEDRIIDDDEETKITHWMPLPEPPNQKG
jgi:hypothetical protein